MSDDHLAFFNALSGSLEVTLSEQAAPISPKLVNLAAPPSATLVDVALRLQVYVPDRPDGEAFRALTEEEWHRVVVHAPSIKLRGASRRVVEHAAPNGSSFTVRDLRAAVEETERQSRGDSEWYGGVDVHHVFFEGIHRETDPDDVWAIYWGS